MNSIKRNKNTFRMRLECFIVFKNENAQVYYYNNFK